MRLEEISVNDLLTECRRVKEKAARDRGVFLHADPCGPDDFVHGDRRLLRTAVSNLIDVSIGHSRPGGKVTIGYRHDPVRGSLVVSDDGAGIPFEELRSMFDIISRSGAGSVDDETEMDTNLLRLSIVRDVADLHGGRIGVRSLEGDGSTFTLHLPCRHAAALSRSSI
jgi:signal transduction histidine kinase